jgi:hypothetical protein
MNANEQRHSTGIFTAMQEVMKEVGAVRKAERNTHQNFNFRGIDAVINAVSPAFRKHGVFCTPTVIDSTYESVQVGQNRTNMGHARVTVRYTFHATDGSSISATVSAESMDSGDKATAKAMSVAYRTALLQTLCLPTDDVDPDADTYVRSEPAPRTQTRSAPAERTYPKNPTYEQSAPADKPAEKSNRTAPLRSDAQAKLIGDLLTQTECDEQLIIDTFKMRIADATVPQAKTIIEALLALKRGDKEVVVGADGVPVIQ